MLGILINLGVFLLYMPPLVVFFSQRLLNGYRGFFQFKYVIPISWSLYLMMFYLIPRAGLAFTFYFLVFNFLFFLADRVILDKVKAFSLAIYACYAISFLWEWPLILAYYGVLNDYNFDAIVLSLFKGFGVPFLYLTIHKLGWRPNFWFWLIVMVFTFTGVTIWMDIVSGRLFFLETHLYRLPWLLLFTLNIASLGRERFYNWAATKA